MFLFNSKANKFKRIVQANVDESNELTKAYNAQFIDYFFFSTFGINYPTDLNHLGFITRFKQTPNELFEFWLKSGLVFSINIVHVDYGKAVAKSR